MFWRVFRPQNVAECALQVQTSARRLLWELFASKAETAARSPAEGIRTKCRHLRTKCVSVCDLNREGSSAQAGKKARDQPQSSQAHSPRRLRRPAIASGPGRDGTNVRPSWRRAEDDELEPPKATPRRIGARRCRWPLLYVRDGRKQTFFRPFRPAATSLTVVCAMVQAIVVIVMVFGLEPTDISHADEIGCVIRHASTLVL